MKLSFSKILTAILVSCAVIITVLLVRREFFVSESSRPEPVPIRQLSDDEWQRASGNGIVLGPAAARVKIVEFYDYECPFCGRVYPTLNEIRQRYPDDIAIIHRHFPLPSHATAYPSAIAVECANEQGKFEPYHEALFKRQEAPVNLDWAGLARTAEVPDVSGFRECVEQEFFSEKVNDDIQLAESLQIAAIPSLIIEGSLFEGVLTVDELDKIVQDILVE